MLARSDMLSLDPDADLIPRLAAGDEKALADLLDRRLNTIHALATRLLMDRSLAEDVAQTVFLKVWEVAPKWQYGNAKLLTWMCRVTTNKCLDILKKKKPLYTDSVPDVIDNQANGLEQLITKDRDAQVKRAMAKLPDKQRAAITLTYYQYLPQKESAEILGLNLKAFEGLLSRAKKNLKTALSIETG